MIPRASELLAGFLIAVLLHLAVLFWPEHLIGLEQTPPNRLAQIQLQRVTPPDPQPEATEPETLPEPEPPAPQPEPEPEPQPESDPIPEPEPPAPEPTPSEPTPAETTESPPADLVDDDITHANEEPAPNGSVETDPDAERLPELVLEWDDYAHLRRVARRLDMQLFAYRYEEGKDLPGRVHEVRLGSDGPVNEPSNQVDGRYARRAYELPRAFFGDLLERTNCDGVVAYVLPSTAEEWAATLRRTFPDARKVYGKLKDAGGKTQLKIIHVVP
jgi:hypothetical protein